MALDSTPGTGQRGAGFRAITTDKDIDEALAARLALIYKHSPICGTSGMAREEITRFAAAHPDVTVYIVDVIQFRPLSRAIANRTGIRHQSPQAILIHNGKPVWNGSHFRVTLDELAARVNGRS